MNAIDRMVSISSHPLGAVEFTTPRTGFPSLRLWSELEVMLRLRNGFYAFEGALHVFPIAQQPTLMGLEEWNSPGLWRHEYGDLCEDLCFFAEDGFGNQFGLSEVGVCTFDAETGHTELLGPSLEDWARAVLADYELLTGYPLFHEWQSRHGRVPAGSRLLPTVPFVLGGEYSLSNLRPVSSVSAMRSRGNLARQIRDLPDGAQVEFKIVE